MPRRCDSPASKSAFAAEEAAASRADWHRTAAAVGSGESRNEGFPSRRRSIIDGTFVVA
jgi:hypothetical protein